MVEYLEARKLSTQASADIRSIIGKHALRWTDKPIDAIDACDVAARYRAVAADKSAQENRLLGVLRRMASRNESMTVSDLRQVHSKLAASCSGRPIVARIFESRGCQGG